MWPESPAKEIHGEWLMQLLSGGCQCLHFAYFSKEAKIGMMFMILALKMIVIPSKSDPMIHSPRIL